MRSLLVAYLSLAASASGAQEFEPPPHGAAVRFASPRGRKLSIKVAPARSASTLGEVRFGAEVLVSEEATAPLAGRRGCRSWLRALPRGYLCAADAQVRRGPFPGRVLEDGRGGQKGYRYALVRSERAALYERPGGERPARVLTRGAGVTISSQGGRAFVRTAAHLWARTEDLDIAEPTVLRGLELAAAAPAERFRLGWLVPDLGAEAVPLFVPARLVSVLQQRQDRQRPGDSSEETLLLERYTPVTILGPGARGRVLVRALLPPGSGNPVPRGEVEARHLRRVLPATDDGPVDLRPGEHWIDINLSQQVAVAYEGREPIFATLVSTAPHGGTPTGSYAVYRKYQTQTMANLQGSRAEYDFRQVPHAQFYDGRFGLHAALWHDRFGHPVSHGCVNLSPTDAARLFRFTEPALPPGWQSMNGVSGTRVIVRR